MDGIQYEAHPGETPFISACIDGKLDIAKALIEQGEVDLDARTEADTSVLEEIVFKTRNRPMNFEITKLAGKDVSINNPDEIREIIGNHPDDEFRTYADISLLVLENGADPDSMNRNGQSVLFTAAGEGADWLVELLAAFGADLDLRDNWGLTALHYASRMGFPEVVRSLLKNGASPNVQDDLGFTPVFEAASGQYIEVLKVLSEYGADFDKGLIKPYKTNQIGTTPLQYARKHGFTSVADFIEKQSRSIPLLKKNIPSKNWRWNETGEGHEGVKIENAKLLWYSHRENPHSTGIGARYQSFDSFLENGPDISDVPQSIQEEISDFLTEE